MLMRASARCFSATASSEYHEYDSSVFYSPVRPVDFSKGGKAEIFNNNDLPKTEPKYTPWELKEATLKNLLGVFGVVCTHYFFGLPAPLYSAGTLYFGLNWGYSIYGFMGNAITKIELHQDGKSVTVTYKTGGQATLKIKDIQKQRHEKELVQTFEEGFLYPISVPSSGDKTSTFYIYGSSQEAIKNGEVFRAIING